MRRDLLYTPNFMRAARRLGKKDANAADATEVTLTALEEDAFQAVLKTHKLKGKLKGQYACSGGYDLRIVFEIIRHESGESILLHSVGNHDEVY